MSSTIPFCFRLVSWNVLADCYTNPTTVLSAWENRKYLIADALKNNSATDIFFLQEVDHYDDFYKLTLHELGYKTTYLNRPTRKDGLLIGFSEKKFQLIDSEEVYLDDISNGNDEIRDEIYVRNNVGLICLFNCIRNISSPLFIASNCHLYWNPNRPEVKEAQANYLIHRIKAFESKHRNTLQSIPIVLAGDFNILPSSVIYQQICNGFRDSAGVYGCFTKAQQEKKRNQKFIADYNLSKLAKWMRVLGIDCTVESKESQTKRSDKISDTGVRKSPSKADYSWLFDTARQENRVLLTSSRTMRERANCPPSMLIRTKDLEMELSRVCQKFGIEVSEAKFLTVCGKCGGPIESVNADDVRIHGKFVPTDREVFACTQCMQPYWWNDRINSSPARAMRVAERLHRVIKASKGESPVATKAGDHDIPVDAVDLQSTSRSLEDVVDVLVANSIGTSLLKEDTSLSTEDTSLSKEVQEGQRLVEKFAVRSQTISEEMSLSQSTESPRVTHTSSTDSTSRVDTVGNEVITFQSIHSRLLGHEPPYTNCNGNFVGTLDYVFISTHEGNNSSRLEWDVLDAFVTPMLTNTPDGGPAGDKTSSSEIIDLSLEGPLPNARWPSDHLMVGGTLALRFCSSSGDLEGIGNIEKFEHLDV